MRHSIPGGRINVPIVGDSFTMLDTGYWTPDTGPKECLQTIKEPGAPVADLAEKLAMRVAQDGYLERASEGEQGTGRPGAQGWESDGGRRVVTRSYPTIRRRATPSDDLHDDPTSDDGGGDVRDGTDCLGDSRRGTGELA